MNGRFIAHMDGHFHDHFAGHRRFRFIIVAPLFYPASYPAYYCDDPAGFYPDVTECPGGWIRVEPTALPY